MNKQHVIAVIPARYGSTRFPGKMLADIKGKTLIQRSYENAKSCSLLDDVIVATDNKKIFESIEAIGGKAVMTSVDCLTGSDRIAEAIRNTPLLGAADIVVNLQGDHPDICPKTIEKVVRALQEDAEAQVATAVVPISDEADLTRSSIVKCVFDRNSHALYFSRALIPYGLTGKKQEGVTYYQHIGIYAFRTPYLLTYTQMKPTPLQLAEDLEQLKVLENGDKIRVVVVETACIGIDTPEDLIKTLRSSHDY